LNESTPGLLISFVKVVSRQAWHDLDVSCRAESDGTKTHEIFNV